jgi:cytochrome c oxidase cbb3-type subunit III
MANRKLTCALGLALAAGTAARLGAQAHPVPDAPPTASAKAGLPDAPGKDTVERVCGACHSPNIVAGRGLTRQQWSEMVSSMISRGAKGTQAEFAQVIDYLTKNLPPKAGGGRAITGGRRASSAGGGFTVGPNDKQVVDLDAAVRGRKIYAADCVTCHGPAARGTANGADLVRSITVLHDRYGNVLGPFLRKGHPMQSGGQSASLSDAQIQDLSHFLHQQLNDTLRSGPYSKVLNVLTGDPKAGAAYFNGAGNCSSCHSPSGDLAGIASKYDPPALQQRFLFPRTPSFEPGSVTPKPVTVTVTTPDGKSVTGVLDRIDDFDVSLHDSSGEYHSWKRTPDLKIEKHDPYAGHIELLDKYTDKNIHDVVAYLETLK